MSDSDGPAWTSEGRAVLCQMLRDQLVETIDVIRSYASVVPSAPDLELVGERAVPVSRRN
ncbi:hypothetical protein [Streptomyces graminilatus]|uniref:hypothetical protein n=1 Tax=Streptomyces graminilatus TaxID=1464070 RepID=UPI000A52AAE6|nr:hypothetical protein [Streptomyces graminilatus]